MKLSLIISCLGFILQFASSSSEFGIIFDAGSSHTSCYIYTWKSRISSSPETPPKSTPAQYGPPKTGLKLDSNHNETQMQQFLLDFINWAKTNLTAHKSRWHTFPIYLKATAGMRVEPEPTRVQLLGWVRKTLSNPSINPFQFSINQAVIIAGEEEGVFGWITANYLTGNLGKPPQQTVGALDLGGMSTQVTFAYQPSSDILGDFQSVRLWGSDYRLYSHSYLEYGLGAIEARIAQAVLDQGLSANPCINSGHSYTITLLNGTQVTQSGSSNYGQCQSVVRGLLFLNYFCTFGKSCAIGGEYMPPVAGLNMTFYAFSGFAYSLAAMKKLSLNLDGIRKLGQDICSRSWQNLTNSSYTTKAKFLQQYCFQLTYIDCLLRDAYKFPGTETNIKIGTSVDGSDLGWASGSMLLDVNRMSFQLANQSTAASESGGLTAEGKKYRVATFVLAGICVVACMLFGCILCQSRSGNYELMRS